MNTIQQAMMDREQNQMRRQEVQRDWQLYTADSGLISPIKRFIGWLFSREPLASSTEKSRVENAKPIEVNF